MELDSVVTFAGSIVAVVIGAIVSIRRSRLEASTAVTTGFDRLCTQLQGRIQALEDEIAALKCELVAEREKNRLLEARIQELERERAELKAQLAALQPRDCGNHMSRVEG